jgi:hypothetical protein
MTGGYIGFEANTSTPRLKNFGGGELTMLKDWSGNGNHCYAASYVPDNFNRADDVSMGANWTNPGNPTFTSGGFKVLSNSATFETNNDSLEIFTGATFSADQGASASITVTGGSSGDGSGIGLALRATGNTLYRIVVNKGAANNVTIAKFINGTYTGIAQKTTTWVDGDTLSADIFGTTIRVYQNGVPLGADVSDSSIATGSPGIAYSSTVTAATIDNFNASSLTFDIYGTAGIKGSAPEDTAITHRGTESFVGLDNATLDVADLFTIEWVAKRNYVGFNECVIDRGVNSFKVYWDTSGTVTLEKSGIVEVLLSSIDITDTDVHHYVITKNGSTRKLYIDGIDRTDASPTNQTLASNTSYFQIGAQVADGGIPSRATMSDIAIYPTELTLARIEAHAAAVSLYGATVLRDSPNAYYRMHEPSGQPNDSSGLGNHTAGGFTGTAPTYGVSGGIETDPDDTAIFFGEPNGGGTSAPDNSTLDLGDVCSMEGWVKRGTIGSVQMLMSKDTNGYSMLFNSDDTVQFNKAGVGTIVSSTTTITDILGFHHIVCTKNGSTVKIYIDGVDRTGTVSNLTLSDTASDLDLGHENLGFRFHGTLDEMAVYPYALTAAQVLEHYNAAIEEVLSALYITGWLGFLGMAP